MIEKLGPDGHAHHLSVAKILLRLLKMNSGSRDPMTNNFISKSGNVVRLKSQGRKPAQESSHHRWPGCIPSNAHDYVGVEHFDDLAGFENRQREGIERAQARQQAYVLQRA